MFEGCNVLENSILTDTNISLGNNNKSIISQDNEKSKNLLNIKEKPISVLFFIVDKNIHYPMVCYNSNIFSSLEQRLYIEFPELKQKNIYFIANGKAINRSESLEKNNIKNGTNILIYFNELMNSN